MRLTAPQTRPSGRLSGAAQISVNACSCTDRVFSANLPRWADYVENRGERSPSRHPGWLRVLSEGLKQEPYCIEAVLGERVVGLLPLAYVKSSLFGRFLVGLPYLNSGGVLADDECVAAALINRAVELADSLDVRYLELRHEKPLQHRAFNGDLSSKVQMRLSLPDSAEQLWKGFDSKVRNQVRKAEKSALSVSWGTDALLDDFYAVFSRNMHDLGTPVFSRRLFECILRQFPEQAELCVVRQGKLAVAAAILMHGHGTTEVPSASSLRSHNFTNANMLMYWHLLRRTIGRGQRVFDFGRSSVDSSTFHFKKQWGAEPQPTVWQYCVRKGTAADMRRESGRFCRLIRVWRHLPVPLTRLIGPWIVRGIP